MNYSLGVSSGKRFCNRHREFRDSIGSKRSPADVVSKGLALQVLHSDEYRPRLLNNVVNGADVRMIERGSSASFAPEAFQRESIGSKLLGKKLQGGRTSQP